MIKALAHVCLFSRDLGQTEAFYSGVLGLPVHFRFIRQGALFGFYLRVAEGQFIEVFSREHPAAEERPHIGHICLETGDLEAVRAKLDAEGITHTDPKLGADQSWQMWFKDPDGTSIELHQYTPESCQYLKTDCHVDW